MPECHSHSWLHLQVALIRHFGDSGIQRSALVYPLLLDVEKILSLEILTINKSDLFLTLMVGLDRLLNFIFYTLEKLF